eukprot:2585116-Rhodomonas_salina.1
MDQTGAGDVREGSVEDDGEEKWGVERVRRSCYGSKGQGWREQARRERRALAQAEPESGHVTPGASHVRVQRSRARSTVTELISQPDLIRA